MRRLLAVFAPCVLALLVLAACIAPPAGTMPPAETVPPTAQPVLAAAEESAAVLGLASPDGAWLLTVSQECAADGSCRYTALVGDAAGETWTALEQTEPGGLGQRSLVPVAWTEDGRAWLAWSGTPDGCAPFSWVDGLLALDPAARAVEVVVGPADAARSVAPAPGGRAAAFLTADALVVRRLDAGTDERTPLARPGPAGNLVWSADGSAVTWQRAVGDGCPAEKEEQRLEVAGMP